MPPMCRLRREKQGLIMSIDCDIILRRGATPEQLAAVGAALWRWCTGGSEATGIYRHLDNQGLADLIAGTFPAWGAHFWVRDAASQDRRETINRLRRDIP